MPQSSATAALPVWAGEPSGTQEGEEQRPSSSHQTVATPYGEPRGTKAQDVGTQDAGAGPR